MDRYILIPAIAVVLLLVVAFLLAYFSFGGAGNILVVHFDAFRGIDFLGDKTDVYGIIGIGAVLALVNFTLVRVLYSRDKFLARFIVFASVFISILIFVTVVAIISVN